MTAPRRMGNENSETRHRLLDITQRLMLKEGYAAVGVRRVAREAGVAPALVLYYFRTLDDLFLAVLRRLADQEYEAQDRALDPSQPLRSLWELSSRPGAALITEFTALSNHRKAIRAELAAHSDRYRRAQIELVTRRFAEAGTGFPDVPPAAMVVFTTAVARIIGLEEQMGLTTGHEEARELVQRLLHLTEQPTEPGTGD
ncbi:TetR/AcrR family transcriptional regulator [Streptomyces sp. 4F14]|uniref:TetR/AcrR family transcriptional regulator n=1 Tax=Streptomyces sp. 4F14 TaxID=3394380 RepID=UPI003A8B4A89